MTDTPHCNGCETWSERAEKAEARTAELMAAWRKFNSYTFRWRDGLQLVPVRIMNELAATFGEGRQPEPTASVSTPPAPKFDCDTCKLTFTGAPEVVWGRWRFCTFGCARQGVLGKSDVELVRGAPMPTGSGAT